MSSFHKVIGSVATTPGTKMKNNATHVSSGIPSLDHVIGGGLPTGSIFVVEEDVLGNYSRVLSKYFLAEGLVCKQALFVASADEDPLQIVKELPVPCVAPPDEEVNDASNNLDKMKIAWRYEGLSQVESSFGSKSNFGHHFDLSRNVDAEVIKASNLTYWTPSEEHTDIKTFKNNLYHKLLTSIKKTLSKDEQQTNSKDKNILRVNIQSLGSPVWMAPDCDVDSNASCYGEDLIKFIYCLRVLLRDTHAVAFITVPSHLFDDEHLMPRLLYSTDNAVRIESFAGSSKETNPVYKEYHGLFHITKLSSVNSIVPYVPPSLDLAFKLRRKKFIIEKLHLPPELQETSEREQDDITATPKTCGGFKKKDIDF